jgi:hypothetical protein
MENFWSGSAKGDVNFWHMTCVKSFMARKVNTSKPTREFRPPAEVTGGQPASSLAALYLTQQRPQLQKVFQARRRLQITIDGEAGGQIPQYVKITHAG